MTSSLRSPSHVVWRTHVKLISILAVVAAAATAITADVGFLVYGTLLAMFAIASSAVAAIALRWTTHRAVVLPIAYPVAAVAIYAWAMLPE